MARNMARSDADDADLPQLASLSLAPRHDIIPTTGAAKQKRTLLPAPLASAVSLITASSAFSLRVGGLLGDAALYGAKISTLTGFEVGRVVLEGILGRAGQDVVQTSRGEIGRAVAEGMLEQALTSLHRIITQSSFLVSAGFQIGSTSINTSMAIGQTLLSALNAIFGDTETSKAIATIIVMVQREVNADNAGRKGVKLSMADVLTGVVAFALLQQWGKQRTAQEQDESGTCQVIWDIVVLAGSKQDTLQLAPHRNGLNALDPASPLSAFPGESPTMPMQDYDDPTGARARPTSSASFMSALGGGDDFQGFPADDNRSFISLASTSNHPVMLDHVSSEPIEGAFREQIVQQFKPGTNVKVTMHTMTVNSITVEIEGDDHTLIEPPQGYSLVSADESRANKRKLMFQSRSKRRKSGTFEVQKPVPDRGSSLRSRTLPAVETKPEAAPPPPPKDRAGSVEANQKRQRTALAPLGVSKIPVPSSPPSSQEGSPHGGRRASIKDNLKPKKSYRNLVDLLNGSQQKRRAPDRDTRPAPAKPSLRTSAYPSNPRPASPTVARNLPGRSSALSNYSRPESPALTRITPANVHLPTAENLATFNSRERPTSRHHKRASSVYSVMTAASETSMVLHSNGVDDSISNHIASSMRRAGTLPGQYPSAKFAENAMRYLRFSHAAYGAAFIRILGAGAPQEDVADPSSSHPREHHSFSSYTRLPPSTVLLSSFVDPKGVPMGKNQPSDAGTVLVHYISLDHEAKAVVLSLRGTLGFEDVLTDLTADYEDFEWQDDVYLVHSGIYAAVRKLLSANNGRVIATLQTALDEFPDYGLVFCGHSLGGGVAALLGILVSEPNRNNLFGPSAYITSLQPERRRPAGAAAAPAFTLPPGRAIHVYSYGAAATVSAPLQRATRGLVTTIIHGQDLIPWLSLGTLRDFQAIAVAFKTDQGDAKAEVRRRVWDGLQKAFRDRTGFGSSGTWLASDADAAEDQWPWLALQGLRSNLDSLKLVPAGEIFHVEGRPVLQRHAFVSRSQRRAAEDTRSFKPATRVTLTHVVDVERWFGEIVFGASMWLDHLPMRYETVLETLCKGLGGRC